MTPTTSGSGGWCPRRSTSARSTPGGRVSGPSRSGCSILWPIAAASILSPDLRSPLPIVVIAEMLGVDAADMAQFNRWSDARAHVFNPARTPKQTADLNAAGQELNDYFARAIDARRGRRGDDLISLLVAAEEAGDRLSAREIVITCNLLLIAGNL